MLPLFCLPLAACAQVPQDGFLTAQTAHYRIVFSAKQAWTIYSFTFDDHLIGHERGFYGTVLIPNVEGGNFIGTGHTEGGQEVVHSVKLVVDGQEHTVEVGEALRGSRIELVKESTIYKFRSRATIVVTDSEVIERQELEASEDCELRLMYLFMHCWQPTTTQWLAELPNGETREGKLESNKDFDVLTDTRWVAQYDPTLSLSIVCYTPRVASGKGSATMIWDLGPDRYHKHYTKRIGAAETFEAGARLDYTMIVRVVPGETGDWSATRAATEELKAQWPPE